MLTDGLQFIGNSSAENLRIANGNALPSSGQLGQLFYLTGANAGLRVYMDSGWNQIGGSTAITWGNITGTLASQTDLSTILGQKEVKSEKGQANGYASLNSSARVPVAQLGSGTPTETTYLRGDGSWQAFSLGTQQNLTVTGVTTTGGLSITGNLGVFNTSASGIFAGQASGAVPTIYFINQSGGTDMKAARLAIDSGGNIKFTFLPDGLGSETNFFHVQRNSVNATLITLTGAGVNLAVGTGGLQINGNTGTTGQVLTSNGNAAAPTWQAPGGVQLGTANTFTKAQTVSPATLTDAATITVDASASNNFRVVLAGNRTLANPTNLVNGQVLNFIVIQDATGSRTLSYGSMYKWPGGTAPTLSTGVNAIDVISAYYDGTLGILLCGINKAFA